MFTVALYAIAQKWKKSKYLSSDEWINNIYIYVCVYIYIYMCIYTIEHYSSIKRNEVLINATTCMNLENVC